MNNKEKSEEKIMDKLIKLIRHYAGFIKFVISSLSGTAVDFVLFYIFSLLIENSSLNLSQTGLIFAATVTARIAAGTVNFLMNHFWSFESHKPAQGEAIRYAVVFVGKMLASASAVSILNRLPVPTLILKAIVDLALFFVSYRIQKRWVFTQ